MKGVPVLLEPHMSLEVPTPEEYVGGIVGNICSRRGKVLGIDSKGSQQIISAEAPLSEMFGYATTLRSLSSGRAAYSMHFEKYVEVPAAISEKLLKRRKERREVSIFLKGIYFVRDTRLSKNNLFLMGFIYLFICLITSCVVFSGVDAPAVIPTLDISLKPDWFDFIF